MKRFAQTAAVWVLRSFFAASLAAVMLPLIGATSPVLLAPPAVVVYPFVGAQGVDPNVGSSVAVVLANQISQLGGVTVKPAPPGTQQRDFLTAAQAAGADYYISGYVTPLGDQVSVVEQLVSTRSGSIVWSNTAQLAVYGDARSSGTQLHDAILQYQGRAFSTLDTQSVVPHPSPPAKAVASQPIPTSTPSTQKSATVLDFGGTAQPSVKEYAPAALIRTLGQYGFTASRAPIASKDVQTLGFLLCAQNGSDFLIGGDVALFEDIESGVWYNAGVVLNAYSCSDVTAKPKTITATATSGSAQTAVDIAVNDALRSYLGIKGKR